MGPDLCLNKYFKLTKYNHELQLPQWETFTLDKLIHFLGALEIKGSHCRTQKCRGKIIFLPLEFLATHMKPTGISDSFCSLQMGSWENQQKPARVKIFTRVSSPRSLPIAASREEGNISFHPLLYNQSPMNLVWGYTLVIDPFPPGSAIVFFF